MSDKKNHRKPLGEASFSVSARVAMQLGRESISNSIVAIMELMAKIPMMQMQKMCL